MSRLIAWTAIATAPPGGEGRSHGNPVGITTMRPAPSEMAVAIGVLLDTPPSQRSRPSSSTGGKTPGKEALASSASTAGTECRETSSQLGKHDRETWVG